MLVRLDVEEIKGFLLNIGQFRDNRQNALRLVFHMHFVERDGGEIGKQGAEAVGRETVGAVLGGGLMSGGIRRLRGFHRSLARRLRAVGVVVLKQHWCQRPAHVPLDIEGEHAEEDVGADPVGLVHIQGTDIEIGLGVAEGALHGGEVLVGFDGGVGRDCLRIETGTNNIHTVEVRLGSDALLPALPGERRIGDGDINMLADLPAVDVPSDGLVDGGGACPVPGPDRGCDLLQRLFRRHKKILAFTGPLLLQARVEADHQPLAGERVMRHLRDGIRNQFRGFQRRHVRLGRFEQLADIGGGEGRDPVDHRRLEILPDAAGGDHAAVPHQRHLVEAETVPDLVHLCGQRRRTGGIPGEHLHRDRTAIRGAEQAIDDLSFPLLPVAVIAELRERATGPFDITRRDVVEQQCLV